MDQSLLYAAGRFERRQLNARSMRRACEFRALAADVVSPLRKARRALAKSRGAAHAWSADLRKRIAATELEPRISSRPPRSVCRRDAGGWAPARPRRLFLAT